MFQPSAQLGLNENKRLNQKDYMKSDGAMKGEGNESELDPCHY